MAAGVLYKLKDYILHVLLIDEYYTIACSIYYSALLTGLTPQMYT